MNNHFEFRFRQEFALLQGSNCHSSFFFLFSLSPFFLEGLSKVYLPTFNDLLPRKRVTKIGPISMDILKKVCLAIVIEDVIAMRVTHVTPCALRYSR